MAFVIDLITRMLLPSHKIVDETCFICTRLIIIYYLISVFVIFKNRKKINILRLRRTHTFCNVEAVLYKIKNKKILSVKVLTQDFPINFLCKGGAV